MIESHPDHRALFQWARSGQGILIPASDETVARVVYATYGIVLPPVPLRKPGIPSADTILESAPVTVGGQQVIYRMRHFAEQPKYIILDAVTGSDSKPVIVRAVAGFGYEAWIPLRAVSTQLQPDTTQPSQRARWIPKGCPETPSTRTYCG